MPISWKFIVFWKYQLLDPQSLCVPQPGMRIQSIPMKSQKLTMFMAAATLPLPQELCCQFPCLVPALILFPLSLLCAPLALAHRL